MSAHNAEYGRPSGPPETMFDIIEMARDWRYSDELIGLVVRAWVRRLDASPDLDMSGFPDCEFDHPHPGHPCGTHIDGSVVPSSEESHDAQNADTERGWHGWSRGGVALHIGPVPGRKSVALYSHVGVTATVLAYFRDFESAVRALAVLDHLCRVKTCGGVKRAEHIDGSQPDA